MVAQQRPEPRAGPEGGCSSPDLGLYGVPGALLHGWRRQRGCPRLQKVFTGWGAVTGWRGCEWTDWSMTGGERLTGSSLRPYTDKTEAPTDRWRWQPILLLNWVASCKAGSCDLWHQKTSAPLQIWNCRACTVSWQSVWGRIRAGYELEPWVCTKRKQQDVAVEKLLARDRNPCLLSWLPQRGFVACPRLRCGMLQRDWGLSSTSCSSLHGHQGCC